MKIGVQTYSSWHAATQRQEDHHGPHNHMLPQSGVPRQRTKRPREHWHPLVQGQALHLHGVPQGFPIVIAKFYTPGRAPLHYGSAGTPTERSLALLHGVYSSL